MRNVEKVSSASNMTGWTNVLEEVLSWLLEAEDHLMSLNSLGQKHLETVKSRFYNHEDFMLELKSHQNAVGEVIKLKYVLILLHSPYSAAGYIRELKLSFSSKY